MTDSIFVPHFTITPEIESLLADIESQRWLIENMLLLPKHQAWIQRQVRVRRAAGTTRIEGAGLDESEVRKLDREGAGANPTDDERANLNALDAYEFIDFVGNEQDIPIDELVIRELNRRFSRGESDTVTPGSYRKGQNTVGPYTPPDQGDVPALMRSFALWLRTEDEETHPIVKAAIAHLHLVAIHPFWDGNGRTARGLATLVMQRSNFGFRRLLDLEGALFDARQDYFSAIERALGKRFSPDYDATSALEFMTGMALSVARQLTSTLTDWHREMSRGREYLKAAGLPPRLADALAYAHQTGAITRSEYIEITGVSPVTASRDLAKLVETGLFVSEGKTRSRVYRPPEGGPSKEGSADEQQLGLALDETAT